MELFFYFLVYGFAGWLLENSYSWFTKRVFFKENFLLLPLKPMYGIAPVLLVISAARFPYWFVILPLCFLIPSFVEYATGALLEKTTRRKWWDYSDGKYHVHGHVCLLFSCYWVALSLVVLYWIQPTLTRLFAGNPTYWHEFSMAFIVPFFIDAFVAILTLKGRGHNENIPVEE